MISQPQQKSAAAVNFYPIQRTFWNFLYILFGFISTQILNLCANKKNSKLTKYSEKLGSTLFFRKPCKGTFSREHLIWEQMHLRGCFKYSYWQRGQHSRMCVYSQSKCTCKNVLLSSNQKFNWDDNTETQTDRDLDVMTTAMLRAAVVKTQKNWN